MKHLIILSLVILLTTTALASAESTSVHACSCNATDVLHKVPLEEVHTNICADFVFDNLTLPGCWNVNWTRQNCTENPTSSFNFDVVMDIGGIEMYQCLIEIMYFICMNNLWSCIGYIIYMIFVMYICTIVYIIFECKLFFYVILLVYQVG